MALIKLLTKQADGAKVQAVNRSGRDVSAQCDECYFKCDLLFTFARNPLGEHGGHRHISKTIDGTPNYSQA